MQLQSQGGRKELDQLVDGPAAVLVDGLYRLRFIEQADDAAGYVKNVSVDVVRLIGGQPGHKGSNVLGLPA